MNKKFLCVSNTIYPIVMKFWWVALHIYEGSWRNKSVSISFLLCNGTIFLYTVGTLRISKVKGREGGFF